MQIGQEEKTSRYALGWLILDYLRVFTWPAIALFVVMFGWNDLMLLLRDREVNLFGVAIGQKVEGVQRRAEGELEDISFLVGQLEERLNAIENGDETDNASNTETGAPDARALTQQIETKIDSLRGNLAREVEQVQMAAPPVQQSLPTPAPNTPSRREQRVASLEQTGFEAMLARDYETALDAFTKAREIWPSYHNVAEMQRLLAARRADPPQTEQDWLSLFEMALIKFSWGMPDDIRAAMRAEFKRK